MDGCIVVGYDGSEPADLALAWALAEAANRRLPVRLVHVRQPQGATAAPTRTDRVDAEVRLARVAADAHDWGRRGIIVTSTVEGGAAAEESQERTVVEGLRAASESALMVVVGERGTGGFAGLRIGSVAAHLAAYAHCPVVVVRGPMHVPDSRPVVVGVDGGPHDGVTVGMALQEAALRGVDLVAVHACALSSANHPADPAAEQADARAEALLDRAVAVWHSCFPRVGIQTRLLRATAAHALTTASHEAQLLVVGARGSGGFADLPLGGTSQQVLQHAVCSVLIVRTTAHPCSVIA